MQEKLRIIKDLLHSDSLNANRLIQIEQLVEQNIADSKIRIQFLQQVYDQLVVIPKDKNYEACQEKKLLQHKLDTLKSKITNQILEIKYNL